MQVEAGNSCTIIYLFSLGEAFEGKMMQSMVLHFLLSYRSAVVCLFALIIISIYSREALKASVYLYGSDQITMYRLWLPHFSALLTSPPSTRSLLRNQSLKISRSYFLFFVFILLTPPPPSPLLSPLPAHTLNQLNRLRSGTRPLTPIQQEAIDYPS